MPPLFVAATRFALLVSAVVLGVAQATAQPPVADTLDIVISGGRVVDGTGAPSYRADIGILGDRIHVIGDLRGARSRSRLDAGGLVVAPGFIDMLGQSEFNLLVDNRAASKLLQGVTTEITGEGGSIAPLSDRMITEGGVRNAKTPFREFGVPADWRSLADYFGRLERIRPAINLATFVGAGGVRDYVIGRADRPATPPEMEQMKRLVAEAMDQGAIGLSSSLQYVPDGFATTEELVELAKVATRCGGIYATHQRSEGDQLFESLDEVFTIAERAGLPAEIFHLKAAYRQNWGRMPSVLRRIEAARARGLDVTANIYPYTASSNPLEASLPGWVREGGFEKMTARLADPAQRARIRDEMEGRGGGTWENQYHGAGGGAGILLVSVFAPGLRQYEGLTLAEIGVRLGKDPRDVAMDIVVADRGRSRTVNFVMSEDDVRAALRHPLVTIGTDSAAKAEDGPLAASKSHPRAWGTFPRILGKYVREEGLLTLEEAVRKMTSQPAARVRLHERGVLRSGMAADIVVFDAATIRDVATFADPNHYSVGVMYLLVNGRVVVTNGTITSERPGRALRGPGCRAAPRS